MLKAITYGIALSISLGGILRYIRHKKPQEKPPHKEPEQFSQENPKLLRQSEQKQPTLPKYPELCKEMSEILQQLIDKNYLDDALKFYVKNLEGKQELFAMYKIKSPEAKKELGSHCDRIIEVRKNGNCFYTAFAYQLLKYIIKDIETLQNFQHQYSSIQFKILNNDTYLIEDIPLQRRFIKHFFQILQYFLQIEDKELRYKQFHYHFAAHERQSGCDGFFNILSVIFLKNLCNHFLYENQYPKNEYKSINFLQWGAPVYQEELVAELLSENLEINVKLILFFDTNSFDANFTIIPFEQQNFLTEIILLQKSNLYNIGVKENKDQAQID